MTQEAITSRDVGEPQPPEFLGVVLKLNSEQAEGEAPYRELVQRYLTEHEFDGDMTPGHSAAFFGIARYQSALERGREELACLFSADELEEMAVCFGNKVFDFSCLGVLGDVFRDGEFDGHTAEFRRKDDVALRLEGLSFLEGFALADAFERIWNVVRPRHPDLSGTQMVKAAGIAVSG